MLVALRRWLAVALATVALLAATAAPASAVVWEWHRDYYENHFRSWFTCVARGEGVIGMRSRDQRIRYAVGYFCHKPEGDARWSMDVLFRLPICPKP